MNKNIENYVHAAYANQKEFQKSVELVKSALRTSINNSSDTELPYEVVPQQVSRTGWLKGFLSYPWMMICTIIPVLESLD